MIPKKLRTRPDNGHVNEDVEPNLPVLECRPDMPECEGLGLSDSGIVIFYDIVRMYRGRDNGVAYSSSR